MLKPEGERGFERATVWVSIVLSEVPGDERRRTAYRPLVSAPVSAPLGEEPPKPPKQVMSFNTPPADMHRSNGGVCAEAKCAEAKCAVEVCGDWRDG